MAEDSQSLSSHQWRCCGESFPREEIVYFCQIFMLYSVIIIGLVNLMMWWQTEDSAWREFWISTVSGGVGYLLPQPRISEHHQLRSLRN